MTMLADALGLTCPLRFCKLLWPDVMLFKKQQQIILSVKHDGETLVPAANQVGKDFIAGLLSLGAFLAPWTVFDPGKYAGMPGTRSEEVRVVTTSVRDGHLKVLWGEINKFIQTARVPLTADKGGPLVVNHRDIRKLLQRRDGGLAVCPKSYLIGLTSERAEGLAGHHAPWTLGVGDEASALDDVVYTQFGTWARSMLFISNPLQPRPGATFFKDCVTGGDVELR